MTTSKFPFLRFIGAASCLLLSTCSSEAPEDPLKTATGFCGEWGNNVCVESLVNDCSSEVEECKQAQTDYCLDRVTETLYTGRGAAECLAFVHEVYRDGALDREERDALVSLGAPCDQLLSGSGEAGEECREDKDCVTLDGLACVVQFGEERGQCQEPKKVLGGGKCTSPASVCEVGQYCNGSNCVAKSAEGEDCSDEVPCDESTSCIIETGETTGLCEAKLGTGKDCVADDDCVSGLCDRNADEETGLCLKTLELNNRVDICDSFR